MVRVPRIFRALILILALAAALCAFAAAKPSASRWIFIDLGTLGTYASFGSEVNNRGDVAGASLAYYSTTPVQDEEGFLWSNGTMRSIGKPPGTLGAIVTAMNEKGEMCGEDSNANLYTWRDGLISTATA